VPLLDARRRRHRDARDLVDLVVDVTVDLETRPPLTAAHTTMAMTDPAGEGCAQRAGGERISRSGHGTETLLRKSGGSGSKNPSRPDSGSACTVGPCASPTRSRPGWSPGSRPGRLPRRSGGATPPWSAWPRPRWWWANGPGALDRLDALAPGFWVGWWLVRARPHAGAGPPRGSRASNRRRSPTSSSSVSTRLAVVAADGRVELTGDGPGRAQLERACGERRVDARRRRAGHPEWATGTATLDRDAYRALRRRHPGAAAGG